MISDAITQAWFARASSIRDPAISSENCSGDRELTRDIVTGPAAASLSGPPHNMLAISMQSRAPCLDTGLPIKGFVAQDNIGKYHVQMGGPPVEHHRVPPS